MRATYVFCGPHGSLRLLIVIPALSSYRNDDIASGVCVSRARSRRLPWIWSPSELDRVGESRLVLVLTRKAKQSIMIGDDIEVTILSSDRTKVRIGIQAPAEVPVHRTEIYLEIQEQGSSERSVRARKL